MGMGGKGICPANAMQMRMRSIGPKSSDVPEHPNPSVRPELEPPTAPDYAARKPQEDGAVQPQELHDLRYRSTEHGARSTVLCLPRRNGVWRG